MAKKYLDSDGLLYFWQKIKAVFVTDVTYNSTSKKIQKTKAGATSDVVTLSTVATSGSYEDLSNKPTIPEGVAKSTTTPKMDGTASVGSETKFAAGDHVHPTDTSRVPTTRKVNGHALSADISLTASDVEAVPTTRTINDKALSEDITLGASDVGAVPTTRKVNGHALNADVTVTASDIGVENGAEVNQNAFSNVKVGTTTVAADAKTDTLELVAGSNVTITPDATNDKITIEATDTKYTAASASPLMDGTAAVGSSAKYAREDHVHPSDTSRVPTTRKVNGKALSNDISLSATDVGALPDDTAIPSKVSDLTNDSGFISSETDPTVPSWAKASSKPSYTANEVGAIPTSAKGASNGVCPLNASSKIDAAYLPSYVDDVIEAYARSGQTALSQNWLATDSASGTVITPETGKIYVLMTDSGDYAANTQFRWGGTSYVKLADGGVTSITNAEIDTIVAS